MSKNLKFYAKIIIGLWLINFLGNQFYQRFDLTQDKRYTLTNTTHSVLDKVDNVLSIKVYLEGDFPAEFKRLQIETKQF